ncbi:glycosyltransferase family 4 protein [Planctomycetaceae bacterium SH139]
MNRSYWPDHEATGQLLTDLCECLAERYDVHVVCGQPNSSAAGDQFLREGRQSRCGVTIHRLAHYTFPKSWPAGRLLNLVSFTRAVSKYLSRSQLNADIFISETDPFMLPPVVAKHARRRRARFVAYLQDIYPDVAIAIERAREGLITGQIRRRLRQAYQAADQVIVLGEDMCDRLADWGLEREKLSIVPNWVDCQQVTPIKENNSFRALHHLEDRFVVMHSGNMGLTQNLDVVVAATRSPLWPRDAVLLLVGDGAMRGQLEELASQGPQGRVRFLPYQPRHELSLSLSAADVHLVSMDHRITGCLFPSKFYGILASASPVMMIAPEDSEPSRIVRTEQIGWTCPPGDPERIAQAVAIAQQQTDVQELRQRARALAERSYDRVVACAKFENILLGLFPVEKVGDEDPSGSHQLERSSA